MEIDKVKRNSYVYIHKCKENGIPFYVGKGTGKRAHSKSKRSNRWQEKVDSLDVCYEVEIVKNELSETEAYELERELIKKYGCEWNNSGSLVNQSSGGDVISGDGITFDIELPAEFREIIEQDDDFKDLGKNEQKDFINSILPKIIELSELYKKIILGSEESYTMLYSSVSVFFEDLPRVIKKYNSSKISFREFATHFQDYIWDLEAYLEEAGCEPQNDFLISLAKSTYDFFNEKLDLLYDEK